MVKRKTCVVTGSRAEYGLLRRLIKKIKNESNLDLQIIATGMHLSPKYGLTYKEIEEDGYKIDKKIDIQLISDSRSAISKSTGLGLVEFSDVFNELNPDIVILLGDRFEIFSAAIAATFLNIPIAHIHGGETTEGAFDEAIRHSITKMSRWHFVASQEYKKRVIQLGENPKFVYNVGSLGIEAIKKIDLLSKNDLKSSLDIKFSKKNILVTYHPETLSKVSSHIYFKELIASLNEFKDIYIIFTMPNADPGSSKIQSLINNFLLKNPKRSISFISMGQLSYLSTMKYVDGVMGNSSSGLIEAPSLNIGTINIGDRQKGRLKANSVINCLPSKKSIIDGINKLYSEKFQKNLLKVKNPYGDGNVSDKIIKILKEEPIPKNLNKQFYDL